MGSRWCYLLLVFCWMGCQTHQPFDYDHNLLNKYRSELKRMGGDAFLRVYLEDYEFNQTFLDKVSQRRKPWLLLGCDLLYQAKGDQHQRLKRKLVKAIQKRRMRSNPREILLETCQFRIDQ